MTNIVAPKRVVLISVYTHFLNRKNLNIDVDRVVSVLSDSNEESLELRELDDIELNFCLVREMFESYLAREEDGAVFTPLSLARFIVRKRELDPNRSFLDLSAGGGVFPIAYWIELVDRNRDEIKTRDDFWSFAVKVATNIKAIDINEDLVILARLAMFCAIVESSESLGFLRTMTKNEWESLALILRENVLVGNSLLGNLSRSSVEYFMSAPTKQSKSLDFDWVRSFPDAFKKGNKGFDLIATNVPYISLNQANSLNYVERLRSTSKNWAYAKYARDNTDLSAYFVLRIAELLAVGGSASVLINGTVFDATHGEKIKKFLLEKTRLTEVVFLKDHPFEKHGKTIKVTPAILSFSKEVEKSDVTLSMVDDYDATIRDGKYQRTKVVSVNDLKTARSWYQALVEGDAFVAELSKVATKRVKDFSPAYVGVKTGANDFFLLPKESEWIERLPREALKNAVKTARLFNSYVVDGNGSHFLFAVGRIASVPCPYHCKGEATDPIAQYISTRGTLHKCEKCRDLATKEANSRHDHDVCSKCDACKSGSPCNRPVDKPSLKGKKDWYSVKLPKERCRIAIYTIADTRVAVMWNRSENYFLDNFALIDSTGDLNADYLLFGYLLSDFGQIQLQKLGYFRTREDGTIMLKLQCHHINSLVVPDFNAWSESIEEGTSLVKKLIENHESIGIDEATAKLDDFFAKSLRMSSSELKKIVKKLIDERF